MFRGKCKKCRQVQDVPEQEGIERPGPIEMSCLACGQTVVTFEWRDDLV